ncbi:unnamed protein product [Effrenium voratum]|nr:unnamed protein product [Effrenium voratum]
MESLADVAASLPVQLDSPLELLRSGKVHDAGNVLPFAMTQVQALKQDPTLTATSFGYVTAEYTLGPSDTEPLIPGLTYLPDFLSEEEERQVLAEVDGDWDDGNKSRRTKQYGYGFHWRNRHSNALAPLRPPRDQMPASCHAVLDRLKKQGHIPDAHFHQCIVNDYLGGQGIKPHRDREFFGEVVLGMSLLEPTVMDFKSGGEVRALLLEPRSVLILEGEARWSWQHGITGAPTLLYRGALLQRGRRTSLTFRTIMDESVITQDPLDA